MGHTAAAIAGGDLSHRVETTDPRTEVGRLGISLNAMLDRLEHAFAEREASEERLRRFIADASHELRTPLASIRGYAELFRMGAARDPADVEKAMRRIEDEAARMGVLVEDLLTLARLDEVRDTPHAELDLAALVRDAVDDGRATAPSREIGIAHRRPAAVLGDRRPAAPGARQPAAQRVRPHARGDADRGEPRAATATCASRSATTARACPPATPRRSSSASGARGRTRARPRRRRARPGHRGGDRRRPRRRRARRQRAGRRRHLRGHAARRTLRGRTSVVPGSGGEDRRSTLRGLSASSHRGLGSRADAVSMADQTLLRPSLRTRLAGPRHAHTECRGRRARLQRAGRARAQRPSAAPFPGRRGLAVSPGRAR